MSIFERTLPRCRLAATHFNDTMQRLASRELGDANRWTELVWINSLTYPYLTDDPARVVPGVLLTGSFIKIPAPVGVYSDISQDGRIFERDCALVGKLLREDSAGDIAIFSGVDNLKQQLTHVVITPRGQATRHPAYGCMIWRLLGTVNGPVAAKMGSQYVKAALASDYRVKTVDSSVASIVGDTVAVTTKVSTIQGSSVDVQIN